MKLPARFLEFLALAVLMFFVALLVADRYLSSKLLPVERWKTVKEPKGGETEINQPR
jgi:hypothetical protein